MDPADSRGGAARRTTHGADGAPGLERAAAERVLSGVPDRGAVRERLHQPRRAVPAATRLRVRRMSARKSVKPVADPPSVPAAWALAWRRALVQLVEHVPLVAGVVATAAVHAVRERVFPGHQTPWAQVVDYALLAAAIAMGLSLVMGPGVRLVTELAELVAVGKNRVIHSWRTGQRLPATSWEPEEPDE